MRKSEVCLVGILMVAAALCCVHAQETAGTRASRWTRPAASGIAQLPKLRQPLQLDGELKEWAGAACIPARSEWDLSSQAYPAKEHGWRGPMDASMEVYAAWNEDGLCVGALVYDDEVRSDRSEGLLWQQDCFEVFFDGRVGDKFMKPPYTKGAHQLLIKPPMPGNEPALELWSMHDKIQGARAAGKRTATGYTLEVLVPWSAFPDLKPKAGSEIGIQVALDDYDARDGETDGPRQLNYSGTRSLFMAPERFVRTALVEDVRTGPDVSLTPLGTVRVESAASELAPLPVTVDLTSMLAERTGSVVVRVAGTDGKVLFESLAKTTPLPKPWDESRRASLTWTPKVPADGIYTVRATFYGKDDKPLGTAEGSVLIAFNTVREALDKLQKADLSAMAHREPFKAAAYLAVGVTLEKFKRATQSENYVTIEQSEAEMNARLSVLSGATGGGQPGDDLYSLLNLGGNPEAQVVVEFLESNYASVSFYWGAVPLGSAWVSRFATPEEARKSLEPPADSNLLPPSESFTFENSPARFSSLGVISERRRWDDVISGSHVLQVVPQRRFVRAVELKQLNLVRAEVAVVLPDCPEQARKAAEAWAQAKQVPLVKLDEAMTKASFVLVGDYQNPETKGAFSRFQVYECGVLDGPADLKVAQGRNLLTVRCPSREMCEHVARLVMAGKPVTVEQSDSLRKMLLAAVAPNAKPAPMPEGMRLYCGDVHMHSFYSDGSPSPVGMALQTIHSFEDFAVLTDHNTLDGVQYAQKLMAASRLVFPLIMGEEVTTSWVHMNAYPLTRFIDPGLSPYETVKAAHVQGAVIQWNHPGYTGSDWELSHMVTGPNGAGTDAWEHLPLRYEAWKASGNLPVITGSTDTHDCACGAPPERTIILGPSAQGDDVAEAIRWGRALAVLPEGPKLFYGSDEMRSLVCAALAEGQSLKAAKAEALKAALKDADVVGLLRASSPAPQAPEEVAAK